MATEKDVSRYTQIEELLEQISLKHNGRPCDPTFMVLVVPQLMEFQEDIVVGALLEILYLPNPRKDWAEPQYPDFGVILKHIKKGTNNAI